MDIKNFNRLAPKLLRSTHTLVWWTLHNLPQTTHEKNNDCMDEPWQQVAKFIYDFISQP